jgi:hypothetical protein
MIGIKFTENLNFNGSDAAASKTPAAAAYTLAAAVYTAAATGYMHTAIIRLTQSS